MKNYICKCKKHFPGYEVFNADNLALAEIKARSWTGCKLTTAEISTIHEYQPELIQEQLLQEAWEDEFRKRK